MNSLVNLLSGFHPNKCTVILLRATQKKTNLRYYTIHLGVSQTWTITDKIVYSFLGLYLMLTSIFLFLGKE